jgi:hypothetical protein
LIGLCLVPGHVWGASPQPKSAPTALQVCTARWMEMNDTDSVPEGLTWAKYWSRCSKEYAATYKPELRSAAARPGTDAPTAIDEDDPTNSSVADKAACDRKWINYKTQTKAHGWKVYFTFMSRCMP